jgi:predicted metal-dependent HD superfamily phosphohydrolase
MELSPQDAAYLESVLRSSWRTDLGRLVPGSADAGRPSAAAMDGVLDAVLVRYCEPHRRYHSLKHVVAVQRSLHQIMEDDPEALTDDEASTVRLAAWYHDAIYEPMSSTNEADSAELAGADLASLGVSHRHCDSVRRLIMVTAHSGSPTSAAEAILVDADLAILAGPTDAYDAYVANVRTEYSSVSDENWRTGRARVLTSLLGNSRIFHTQNSDQRERAARANMIVELHALSLDESSRIAQPFTAPEVIPETR